MDDGDVVGRNLKKPGGVANRLAGRVHIGLRLQQQYPLAADRRVGKLTLEAAAKSREPVAAGNRVGRHEPDIVAVAGVTGARITETDEEAHSARSRRCFGFL